MPDELFDVGVPGISPLGQSAEDLVSRAFISAGERETLGAGDVLRRHGQAFMGGVAAITTGVGGFLERVVRPLPKTITHP